MTDLHLGAHEGTDQHWTDPAPNEAAGKAGPLDEIRSGVKAFMDVGISIGKAVDRQVADTRALLRRLEYNTPVNYGAAASGTYPATGSLVLNFGAPDQGTYWEVESIAVGGLDVNVTATGTAGLYVAGFLPLANGAGAPGITSCADYANALPNVAFYGGRDIVVNDQEYLFAIIFGGSVGQVYGGNAQVSVFQVASARGDVEVAS